jgi:hypothetical protein
VKLTDRRALQGYSDDYNQAIMDQAVREGDAGGQMTRPAQTPA